MENQQSEQPIINEVVIQAMQNGAVNVRVGRGVSIYELRGILAKALHQICELDIKLEEIENGDHSHNPDV